jgi:rare lipoprotein A
MRRSSCIAILLCACLCGAWASPPHRAKPQVGKASIYSHRFAGKRMANGEKMDPRSDSAASKTLPLGTKARVTNLDTGRSALVTIEDRGPFVPGRIVDVTPATAAQIGLSHKQGLAHVEVAPVELPR